MSDKIIYILHKQGAKSHTVALDFLLEKNNYNLKFREFSIFSIFFKSLVSLNFKLFVKQFTNLGFLISLLFSKNKKIVLGIAPFDSKLGLLLKLLKDHKVYYHTSWACWDKSFHPKTKHNSPAVFQKWKYFLEIKTEHIFCVNKKGKNQLLQNYQIAENKIDVVYHALHPSFSNKKNVKKKKNSFIYYGRMVPQKGIEELLTFFAENKEGTLTLIGDGNQKKLIERFSAIHKNISYMNNISNKQELIEEIAKHQYLVLNAKWEELFSLIIIEGMSQGVIPISSNLTGPGEIITNETGILFKEGELSSTLSMVIQDKYNTGHMVDNAISTSKFYLPESIAEKWKAILY